MPVKRDKAAAGAPSGTAPTVRTASPARPNRALALALALVGIFILAAATMVIITVRHHQQPAADLRPSGIPASVPTRLANLMGLSPLPATPAPGFTLTDQRGHRLALSAFRGRAVVLTFLDTRCTSICPLVSDEFAAADQDLGPLAGKVVFAAVNVNPYHAAVRDIAAFSAQHQLTSIPGWHFFTGPVPQLQAVWRAYHIQVQPRGPGRDTIHTSAVYFIDSHGRERYLAAPMASYAKAGAAYLPAGQIAAWGRGIASAAKSMAS
jgi:cytochrome oxidase Cu insertion factor (SCO1/SenC/PrrC family)